MEAFTLFMRIRRTSVACQELSQALSSKQMSRRKK